MTEHEKLKMICDVVGYKRGHRLDIVYSLNTNIFYKGQDIIDIREIIFTQEFMDKFEKYYLENNKLNKISWWNKLGFNLDNPVDYLYELIFTDEKKN